MGGPCHRWVGGKGGCAPRCPPPRCPTHPTRGTPLRCRGGSRVQPTPAAAAKTTTTPAAAEKTKQKKDPKTAATHTCDVAALHQGEPHRPARRLRLEVAVGARQAVADHDLVQDRNVLAAGGVVGLQSGQVSPGQPPGGGQRSSSVCSTCTAVCSSAALRVPRPPAPAAPVSPRAPTLGLPGRRSAPAAPLGGA